MQLQASFKMLFTRPLSIPNNNCNADFKAIKTSHLIKNTQTNKINLSFIRLTIQFIKSAFYPQSYYKSVTSDFTSSCYAKTEISANKQKCP